MVVISPTFIRCVDASCLDRERGEGYNNDGDRNGEGCSISQRGSSMKAPPYTFYPLDSTAASETMEAVTSYDHNI